MIPLRQGFAGQGSRGGASSRRSALGAQPLRVAITTDWILGGGSERVIRALCDLYPQAEVFTSCTKSELIDRDFADVKIRTGYLNWPVLRKMYKLFPVLRMLWFGSLNLDEFDLVISAGSAECKNLGPWAEGQGPKHMAIVYTPTQYYWVRPDEYSQNTGGGVLSPFLKYGLKLLIKPMRAWDYRAAQKPDQILAISTSVQSRIKKFYGRDSTVVYPPVSANRFTKKQPKPDGAPDNYLLTVGRQVPYKRFDLAIEAAKILDRDLVMIGNGPEHDGLVAMAALGASSSRRRGPIDSSYASSKIVFPSNISDSEIVAYFQHADALLFPGEDDFGITAVEALAAGTPVVAYKAGGALDYIIPGTNGILFDNFKANDLASAVKALKTTDSDKIIKTAAAFDVQVFSQKISQKVQGLLQR